MTIELKMLAQVALASNALFHHFGVLRCQPVQVKRRCLWHLRFARWQRPSGRLLNVQMG